MDQDIDCLKFNLESGNVYNFHEIIEEFDHKILEGEEKNE